MTRTRSPRRRWIQDALRNRKRGALHRQLGYPLGEVLPMPLLREAVAHPEWFKATRPAQERLVRRARLALTLRSFHAERRAG